MCRMALSWHGGSLVISVVCLFHLSLHTSLVLLHCTELYRWHMAFSACFKVLASMSKFSPRDVKAWHNSLFSIRSFNTVLLPHPVNLLVESQPLNACILSKPSQTLCPRLSVILVTLMYAHALFFGMYSTQLFVATQGTSQDQDISIWWPDQEWCITF